MRVLVLNERDPLHPQAGGAEIHVSEIFGRLARRGHEVTLATSSYPGAALSETVNDMLVQRLGPLAAYYPRVVAKCALETARGDYDVVVECLNKVPFFSPAYSAVPVLAIVHHLFGKAAFLQVPWPIAATVFALEKMIPTLYQTCPFVSISESSADDLVERGLPRERLLVSHCGIDPPSLQVETSVPRRHRVVYLGRLEPYKHVDVMLRAAASLRARFPELEILVVGRGSARESLEQLAASLDLADCTRFTGFVSDEERDALLASSRVCVCPSEKEGWGLTVIESNALGTPVVANDAPGLRDSVRHGQTGFLVPNVDVAGFAKHIGELLEDDALAIRMSTEALAWSKTFDWDKAADDMEQALERTRTLP